MVAISSVGSQSLIAQQQTAASQAASSGVSTPVANTASASASSSTVVTLGQSSVSPTYSAIQTAPTPVWESAPNDLVSLRMAGNMSASKLSGRFGGLGAALLDQVRDGGSSFSQSVIQLAPGTSVDTVSAADFHTQAANEIKLSITTRGGATVGITLGSDGDRLAVKLSVSDGELSDTERAAIGKLAQSFQQSIDALTEVPPRLDISGLTQYDSTAGASRIRPTTAEPIPTTRRIFSGISAALCMARRIQEGLAANNRPSSTNKIPNPMRKSANAMDLIGRKPPVGLLFVEGREAECASRPKLSI